MAALEPQVQPTVLVCNEVSHLSYGSDAANVLCHVVDARSVQRRSMLFITHKPLKHWGAARHDNDLAAAIIDRVLERGRIVALQGLSMRTHHIEDSDHELCPLSPREARSASDRLGNLTRIPPDPPTHTARPVRTSATHTPIRSLGNAPLRSLRSLRGAFPMCLIFDGH